MALVPLDGLPAVSGLLVRAEARDDLRALNREVRARTSPGEPIFVYPSSPLLYIVTQRPNPTRYTHLYPGALSQAELDRLPESLRASGVRLIVISLDALLFWGAPGVNQRLEDTLANEYIPVGRFGGYRLLTRRDAT
jgi:hypothetical protein